MPPFRVSGVDTAAALQGSHRPRVGAADSGVGAAGGGSPCLALSVLPSLLGGGFVPEILLEGEFGGEELTEKCVLRPAGSQGQL